MLITNGNISLDEARCLQSASPYPDPRWQPGSTEPWVTQAVGALLLASGGRNVVELGGFTGACSVVLADTLRRMGSGELIVMEHDAELVPVIAAALAPYQPEVVGQVWHTDTLEGIRALPDGAADFAWVDDCHEAPHLVEEVHALIPKVREDGLILFHDVCGIYAIHWIVRYYGGIALNLPRVSAGGGLGILQVRPSTRRIPKMCMIFPEAILALGRIPGNRVVFSEEQVPA
jgi:hypothetical protein